MEKAILTTRMREQPVKEAQALEVLVGVAQARRHHLDLDLVLAGVVDLEVHDLVLARCLPDDGATGLHR